MCVREARPRGVCTRKAGEEGGAGTALNMRVSAVTGQRGEPGIGLNGIESERWWNCMVFDQLMVRRMDPSGRKGKEERER